MRFPHFDFYPGDWMNDSHNAALTYEEWGVHIALLCRMWDQPDCTLPNDDRYLARLLRVPEDQWRQWREVLIDGPQPVLQIQNDRLISPKLLTIFTQACNASRKAKDKADKRWKSPESDPDKVPASNRSNAVAMPQQSCSNASHQSSVISYQDQEKDLLLPRADANDKAEPLVPHESDAPTTLPLTERFVTPELAAPVTNATKPLAGQWASLEAAWMQYCHGSLPRSLFDELPMMLEEAHCPDLDPAVLVAAFREADRHEARTWAYVRRIVDRWLSAGLTTLVAVEADLVAQRNKRAQPLSRDAPSAKRGRDSPQLDVAPEVLARELEDWEQRYAARGIEPL